MKFTLIATIVVLALAQGSLAQDAPSLESIGQYFEQMKAKLTTDLTELMRTHDVANQAQTFLEDKRAQLAPVVAQLQEQLQAATTNMEQQIQPLATNAKAQLQPMIDEFQQQMQAILAQVTEQARALGN